MLEQIKKLIPVLKKQEEWGTYFMGKFYFTIVTNKKRFEVGLTNGNKELDVKFQLQLQKENYPALFHEYIHYLHELSTVIGNVGLGIDLSGKTIFTHWLVSDPKTAISTGYTNNKLGTDFAKVITTQGVLFGNGNEVINGKFIDVKEINYVLQEVYFPHNPDFIESKLSVPKIKFTEFTGSKISCNHLMFGKYFLYEGLAYELDRIIDMQVRGIATINDEAKSTEYTVLRRVAQFVFPQVEKRTYLSLASMALQYVDCGQSFIKMVERVKDGCNLGIDQLDTVAIIKKEISSLLQSKREDFRDAQDEYKNIFFKRKMLSRAFTYLTEKMKGLYDERIKNPVFEIDLVIESKHSELLSIANICDYMYIFQDKDEYMRDFLGTSIEQETSLALKSLLTYDHFYKAHNCLPTSQVELEERHCPFYTCCNLQLRTTHSEICRTRPWKIFEISANTDNQYCWYGQGVLETKGINEN